MKETFVPILNEFIELLKDANSIHSAHIGKMIEIQKQLRKENTKLKEDLLIPVTSNDDNSIVEKIKLNEYCYEFEKAVAEFRGIYQQHIDDTNFMLGKLSSHWGGYIEQIGVQTLLNLLRKDFGAHTFIEKFQRFWHKSRNVEIDLLALSDTHVYIADVKNQLTEQSFKNMLLIMDKVKEQVPEYNHLKVQPVFFCIHADEKVLNACTIGGLWVLRYKGFDRDKPKNSFEWLMGQ